MLKVIITHLTMETLWLHAQFSILNSDVITIVSLIYPNTTILDDRGHRFSQSASYEWIRYNNIVKLFYYAKSILFVHRRSSLKQYAQHPIVDMLLPVFPIWASNCAECDIKYLHSIESVVSFKPTYVHCKLNIHLQKCWCGCQFTYNPIQLLLHV